VPSHALRYGLQENTGGEGMFRAVAVTPIAFQVRFLLALMLGNDSDFDTLPYPKTRALSSRSSNS